MHVQYGHAVINTLSDCALTVLRVIFLWSVVTSELRNACCQYVVTFNFTPDSVNVHKLVIESYAARRCKIKLKQN